KSPCIGPQMIELRRYNKEQDILLLKWYWKGDNIVPFFWVWYRHKERLHIIARKWLGPQDVDDAMSITIEKLCNCKSEEARRKKLDAEDNRTLKSYLITMVKSNARDFYKKLSRQKTVPLDLRQHDGRSHSFEAHLLAEDMYRVAAELIAKERKPEDAELWRLLRDEVPRKEIALHLDVSRGAVNQRVSVLKQFLRRKFPK
ncbi:MAG: sigma-70 family RNA polymerase sigma factor, partial [Bacteroidota bacterium]